MRLSDVFVSIVPTILEAPCTKATLAPDARKRRAAVKVFEDLLAAGAG